MKNSLSQYRSRVRSSIICIESVAIGFVLLNPKSDFNFWARYTVGNNDFLWYLIGFATLIAVLFTSLLIDKALFFGLDEND